MMQLPFVFALLLSIVFQVIAKHEQKVEPTESPKLNLNKLCLNLNAIKLDNIDFTPPQSKWSQIEGIFYAYTPTHSQDTFQSMQFPITQQKPDTAINSEPTNTFNFKGSQSVVGCWIEPDFDTLNIKFKLYQYFHIVLKANSTIDIPSVTVGDAAQQSSVVLQTLPYQYGDVTVTVDITFQWSEQEIEQKIALSPIGPPIPPVKPPIKAYLDTDTFDSDEVTDTIMADKDPMEIAPMSGESTNWMFVAALCSSMLGLFILVYICVWAYKTYGRGGYESIGGVSKVSVKLGKIRKISLRNHGMNSGRDETRNIMHPNASYTLQD